MRTVAPAKINWTLEVLGRRDDGYHEIRSVMQTIDLCDDLGVWRAPYLLKRSQLPTGLPPGTLVVRPLPHEFVYSNGPDIRKDRPSGASVHRVINLLDPEGQRDARIELRKKIPLAAGLGGGSSDAAAALRCLQRLWNLGRESERLAEIAAQIGSDVTFFLDGGTALAEGRGERVTPLPDVPAAWLVLLVPPISLTEKTKRMYEELTAADSTDGSRSETLAERLRQARPVREQDLHNAFEPVADRVFEGLETYRKALLEAGAKGAHLAGAGPALFALAANEAATRKMAQRIQAPDAKVYVARTLTAAEATAVVE